MTQPFTFFTPLSAKECVHSDWMNLLHKPILTLQTAVLLPTSIWFPLNSMNMPFTADWDEPVPLVFVFHGGTGNVQTAVRMSSFNDVVDQNGFVVVYPNGTGLFRDDKLLTWDGGPCCGYAQENNVDDVGFVPAILTDMQALDIDTKRIYATGMSNGGILSHRLACEAADLFAAVAPVAGLVRINPQQRFPPHR